jgi:hypothetical protein
MFKRNDLRHTLRGPEVFTPGRNHFNGDEEYEYYLGYYFTTFAYASIQVSYVFRDS